MLPHPSSAVSSAFFAVRLPLRGDNGGYFVHLLGRSGLRSCLSAGGAPSATGEIGAPVPDHLPFWFKPDSIFGLSLDHGLYQHFTWVDLSRTAGSRPPCDAGSRHVGSRVHGRSEDRGYVVPQASDLAVTGDARWGSRPMAEHRVMSEDLLASALQAEKMLRIATELSKNERSNEPQRRHKEKTNHG